MGRKKKSNYNKPTSGYELSEAQKLAIDSLSEASKEMIANSTPSEIQNGLQEALGLPAMMGAGSQLSQTDTLFKNNRWYLVSNMRQLLSEIYVEIGLVKTIVDVPVEDGLRGKLDIKTKQLDENQIQDLHADMEEKGDIQMVGQTMKWNRLFGGAAVLVLTGHDSREPLDIKSIKKGEQMEFKAIDMWELYYAKQGTENQTAEIDPKDDVEFYDYYGMQVHKSRVFLVQGDEAPSFVRPRLRGWGLSVVETIVRSINQYLKATDLTFEVLDEFKLDIFKIKGLTTALYTKEGHEAVRKRVAIANHQKSYQNAITMDGEDDYVQKQLSFAGLSEAMSGIRMQVASDLRMPMTKIFGISSAGFSSGEDDIENYNATVESGVRVKAKPILRKIVIMRCLQRFGFVPDDLTIGYEPLRVLSSEQQENVKNATFSRVLQARSAGELSRLEFREAVNKDELLPMRLEIDGIDDVIPDAVLGKEEGKDGKLTASTIETPDTPIAKNSIRKKRKYVPNFGIFNKNKN